MGSFPIFLLVAFQVESTSVARFGRSELVHVLHLEPLGYSFLQGSVRCWIAAFYLASSGPVPIVNGAVFSVGFFHSVHQLVPAVSGFAVDPELPPSPLLFSIKVVHNFFAGRALGEIALVLGSIVAARKARAQ